jgi:F-type H+-transporting ATPase subunit b
MLTTVSMFTTVANLNMWMALVAVDENAANPPSPLDFNTDLALFSFIIFLCLMALLTKFAWKPILSGLERREKTIADQISSAKRMHDESQQTLRDYEQKLAAVAQQATEILAEARRESLAAKDRIVAEAAAEAQKQRDRALADIRAAKDAAVRELAQRSAESAVQLAGNIVGRSLREADHQKLIDDSIDRFVKSA